MFPGHCITKNPSVRRRAENDQDVSQLEAPKSLPPSSFYSRAILCKFELLRICPIKLDSNAPDRHICFHWMTLCFSRHLLVLVQQSFFRLSASFYEVKIFLKDICSQKLALHLQNPPYFKSKLMFSSTCNSSPHPGKVQMSTLGAWKRRRRCGCWSFKLIGT